MLCPKCGFDQPDAHECLRCGVVIAKYVSLRKRREDLDNPSLSPEPTTLVADAATGPAGLDLPDSPEDSQRIWGEIQYIKADTSLLTETLRGLQKRHEALAQGLAQCAHLSDVKKMSQDLSDVSHVLGTLYTTVHDLTGRVESLQSAAQGYPVPVEEMSRIKEALAGLIAREAEQTQMAKDLAALRHQAEQWQAELEVLKEARVQELSTPTWERVREQLIGEVQGRLAAGGQDLLTKLESILQAEVRPLQGCIEVLAPKLAEVDRLKEALAGLAAQLGRLEAQPPENVQSDVTSLRERFETLAPRVAELDHLKASFAELAQRWERSESPRPDLTSLTPRLETLEAFHKNITKTLEELSGASTPDTQLEALKQWADRVLSPSASKAALDAGNEWREMKDDIKLIKVLLSDFMKQTHKALQ